jgi:glycosyltransferase involved in cell wall biosynthesis
MKPTLSVVIIGRNEGPRLVRCIDSTRSIRGVDGQIETIYVDSGSTDGSRERAAEMGVKVVPLASARPSAAQGRNAGWKIAAADYVLFLDGDTILDPDYPRLALEAASRDHEIAAVWGSRREIHPEQSVYNRVLDLDWIFAPGFTDYCGGDVLMRRSVLDEVGGYDPELIAGEEPELCRRIRAKGYKILHVDAQMTGHDLAMRRFGQYWRRAVRTGHAYAEVSNRYRATDDPLWTRESRHNLVRGTFWMASLLVALAAAVLRRSGWPIAMWLLLLAVLSARSAWKVRWKSRDAVALLFYGIHSHFQQAPVMLGQLGYFLSARRGKKKPLIEYKSRPG